MLCSIVIVILCFIAEHVTRIALSSFIELSYNTGAAFGIFGEVPGFTLLLSGSACLIIFCVLIFISLKTLERVGLSIMLGGALSNLLERILLGHVIDWIPLPFIDLNFNIADVEISLGALIAFLQFAFDKITVVHS